MITLLMFADIKQKEATTPKHLTAEQVMEILHCGKNKLKPMRERGELIFFKTGKFCYTYPPEQFTAEFIKKKLEEKKPVNYSLKKGK